MSEKNTFTTALLRILLLSQIFFICQAYGNEKIKTKPINTAEKEQKESRVDNAKHNEQKIKTKVLIIGSGPAGNTAGIYAARALLSPIIITGDQPGGQLIGTSDVENFPGFEKAIKGPELMQQMEAQAKNAGTKIINAMVNKVDLSKRPFTLRTSNGGTYEAETIIISTGATAKWLGLPSEKKYQNYGVSSCAVCDGIFFEKKPVVVVGGGNSAVEEALYLARLASKVILIHRRDSLRADKTLQKQLFNNPKISVIWNNKVIKILGDDNPKKVTKVKIQDIKTSKIKEIPCEGVFIAIGHHPNTDLFTNQLKIDAEGYIVTVPGSTQTSVAGVFAAGDVQDKVYRQAVTAAGTGCMAALEAEKFLQSLEK